MDRRIRVVVRRLDDFVVVLRCTFANARTRGSHFRLNLTARLSVEYNTLACKKDDIIIPYCPRFGWINYDRIVNHMRHKEDVKVKLFHELNFDFFLQFMGSASVSFNFLFF